MWSLGGANSNDATCEQMDCALPTTWIDLLTHGETLGVDHTFKSTGWYDIAIREMDINRVSLFNAFRSSTSSQLPVVSRYDDTKQNYLHDLLITDSTLQYAIGKLCIVQCLM